VRILLVEDSPSDAALLEATLTEGPGRTDVVNAETLEGAVAAALEQPFDAVLLDLSLPDSCGLETVVRARAAWPQLPIVVLTGAEDEQLGLEAVRSGVQDYLVKGQAGGAVIARSLRYAIERKRSENEILRMNDELERRVGERTAQLRQLALQVTLAEEEQRRRLAEVLHDNLQQLLVYARLTVGEALSLARGARLRASLGRVEQGLAEAIDVSRSLTAELSPPLLYERGLLAALRWLTEQMRERCSLAVEICAGPDDEPRQEVVRVLLFQCIRELLANVVKHAGVKEAFVTIGRSAGVVRVEVADRGWGFNPEGRAAAAVSGGFGLFSIRERLRQSGGSFEMQSAPGRGSRITLVVPDADEPRRPGRRVSDPPAPSSA
jgi:signal transduction histidine kinase